MFGLNPTTHYDGHATEEAPADDTSFCAVSFIEGCGIDLAEYPIILAVSGGPDSMAMAAHMAAWHRANGKLPLKAIIVDHGIRANAADEAMLVQQRLTEMGLPAEILSIRSTAPSQGVQAWARAQRYRILADAARCGDMPAVVITGHHALDQAETIAMRLAAGSGFVGLKGMQDVTQYGDLMVVRPFLDVQPDQLRKILSDRNIPYVNDPSNQLEQFERIAIRRRLDSLADDGITPNRLRALGRVSARLMAGLDAQIATAIIGKMGQTQAGAIWLDANVFKILPDTAMVHFIRHLVTNAGQTKWPVSEKSASRLSRNLHARLFTSISADTSADASTSVPGRDADGIAGGIAGTLGGLEWHCRDGAVWIYPEAEQHDDGIEVTSGREFYHGIWQLMVPCHGRIVPLGARRAAALRRIAPDYVASLRKAFGESAPRTAPRTAPMRSLWRFPVLMPGVKPQDNRAELPAANRLIKLEDGAIIPHVINDNVNFTPLSDIFTIRDIRVAISGSQY